MEESRLRLELRKVSAGVESQASGGHPHTILSCSSPMVHHCAGH